jgi:site-specific recombinase XerD
MLSSLSKNTILQYNVTLKLWWKFCTRLDKDVFDNSISLVLTFLTDQFNQGASYGSINSHRSALSLFLGNNIGKDEQIKRLLKGVYKMRPSFPKYTHTWDPKIVLDHIAEWYPNTTISLEKITKKLVVLLALCTAHRVQTISLIKIHNIHLCPNGVKIIISDIIKTSAAGREQPILFLPYFEEKTNICAATVLRDYLSITSDKRPLNSERLLITVKRPHRDATAQSISRWIKQVLAESGVDVATFSAHSTRHAATSTAASAGVNVDLIRKTAGWSSTSQTFARFYNRLIIDDGIFARSVCNQPDHR